MNLAPIALFTYNRLWHTQQTLEALQKNELASESELFIFSDGPKPGVEEKIKEVREYLKTITGFKKVTLIERDKNWGLANNIIDGVTKIVNEYGKIIVLEDDLVTTPYFLKFMNEALEFFDNDSRIMSVTGYTYPIKIPNHYNFDIYLFYRSSSWGWATWKKEWCKVDFNITEKHEIFKNRELRKLFNRGGNDLFYMLKDQMKGIINSWAIRFALAHSLHNKLAVFPIKSLVKNIGFDGSGTHCGRSEKFDIELDYTFFPKILPIEVDELIIKNLQKSLNMTRIQIVRTHLRRLIWTLSQFLSHQ